VSSDLPDHELDTLVLTATEAADLARGGEVNDGHRLVTEPWPHAREVEIPSPVPRGAALVLDEHFYPPLLVYLAPI
jgi:hypothetical protein